VAQRSIVDQRILHVHHYGCGSVHAREFLHGQNRLKKLAAATAVLLGDFNPHQPELEKVVEQVFVEDALFVHLLDQRPDFFFGKLVDVVAKQDFVFCKAGQRRGRWDLQS